MTHTTRPTARSSARAFSLIEVMIGSTIMLLIVGVMMGVFLQVEVAHREAQVRSAVARDAQFALESLGDDLRYAGVGVPRGLAVQNFYGSSHAKQLRPIFRVATDKYLAFMGDLPFPNAELNGSALMTDIRRDEGPANDEVLVVSELMPCPPGRCGVSQSLMLGGMVAGDVCNTSNYATRRGCPWGLGKWQANNFGEIFLTMMAPSGEWANIEWSFGSGFFSGGGPSTEIPTAGANIPGIHFVHDYPASGEHELAIGTFILSETGTSQISQLDRVFYSLEDAAGAACSMAACAPNTCCHDCVLRRRQCWGAIGDPSDALFPGIGAAPVMSPQEPQNCLSSALKLDGTPWETVLTDIEDFSLKYLDQNGAQLVPGTGSPARLTADQAANVAAVAVDITICRRPNDRAGFLKQRMSRTFYIDNWGGLRDNGNPTNGACADEDSDCGEHHHHH